jgi:hypothetical protein
MKKIFLSLLFFPLLIISCNKEVQLSEAEKAAVKGIETTLANMQSHLDLIISTQGSADMQMHLENFLIHDSLFWQFHSQISHNKSHCDHNHSMMQSQTGNPKDPESYCNKCSHNNMYGNMVHHGNGTAGNMDCLGDHNHCETTGNMHMSNSMHMNNSNAMHNMIHHQNYDNIYNQFQLVMCQK